MITISSRQVSPHSPVKNKAMLPPEPPRSPITIQFLDVTYRVRVKLHGKNTEEKTILKGITGIASPGRILAIMGPSGSGKSTLLNAIGGRLHHRDALTGTLLYNNHRKMTKQIKRTTGFVAQQDILYPHLTVRETLIFCALLRLPNSTTRKEKTAVTESVMHELGLSGCEHTVISGISGGERKRVSIAHEMLVNPSLLILDEPTSGLDSTAAYRLVLTLGRLAAKGKTIVTSVHQPSSRVYRTLDDLLVLSQGMCIYLGKGSEAMEYMESLGLVPSFPMNPADFLLDLANGVGEVEDMRQALASSYTNSLAPRVKSACLNSNSNRYDDGTPDSIHSPAWFTQLGVLLQRNFKEKRHETLDSIRVLHIIAGSLLAGCMWWRSDHGDIQDRLGLLFFISVFWGVFPSSSAAFTFPQDRAIFVKERSSGMYTLSSYFMARIIGDLPMELILPSLFFLIIYWMTGLKPGISAFFLSLAILLVFVLVSQGVGLAVGALIMDAKHASTLVTITMLAFVLTGGYYVHKLPLFISWIKYLSPIFYCYRLLIYAQYGDAVCISSSPPCRSDDWHQMNPAACIGILLLMFLVCRLLAYMALSRIKP